MGKSLSSGLANKCKGPKERLRVQRIQKRLIRLKGGKLGKNE